MAKTVKKEVENVSEVATEVATPSKTPSIVTHYHSRKQWVYIDGVLDHTIDHLGVVSSVTEGTSKK